MAAPCRCSVGRCDAPFGRSSTSTPSCRNQPLVVGEQRAGVLLARIKMSWPKRDCYETEQCQQVGARRLEATCSTRPLARVSPKISNRDVETSSDRPIGLAARRGAVIRVTNQHRGVEPRFRPRTVDEIADRQSVYCTLVAAASPCARSTRPADR